MSELLKKIGVDWSNTHMTKPDWIKTGLKDRVLWAILVIYVCLLIFAPEQITPSLAYVSDSLIHLLPYLFVSVVLAAAIKVSGADQLIAKVFARSQASGVAVASLFGALSPFCSCGVIPIIAGLLAAGVPLAPVMAFMIASPLMDPEMFVISTGLLGLEFTTARTIGAIFAGLASGFIVMAVQKRPAFADPLREKAKPVKSCCGSAPKTQQGVNWRIWQTPEQRADFFSETASTAWYLGKWMVFAFVLTSLMIAYLPSEAVAKYLGSGALWTIPAAVFVGFPTYVNGYAATPLVAELIKMGMAPGAAMAFLIAGSVACLPSAVAFFGVANRKVFALYLALGTFVSLVIGFTYHLYAMFV